MAKKKKAEPIDGKALTLDTVKSEFKKRWGEGSLMEMGTFRAHNVDVIKTGSISFDDTTGVGGIPRGRVIEVYGPEAAGKTMMTLHWVASVQMAGGTAAFIDAEHALDPKFATDIGVDLDKLLLSQPDSGEQGLEMCELLVRSGAVDIVVVDSVAALVPQAELDGEMGQSHIGAQARLMSQALRKLTPLVKKTNTTVVFINQLRMKIGVMMGNPETTPGGRALKFYAGMRIDVRRTEGIKDGDVVIGHRLKVKIVKNKVAPPFKVCNIAIIYGEGISRTRELLELGYKHKIVEKSGSWMSYNDTRIGNGMNACCEFLKNNPDIMDEIEAKIRAEMAPEVEDETESEDLEEVGAEVIAET